MELVARLCQKTPIFCRTIWAHDAIWPTSGQTDNTCFAAIVYSQLDNMEPI